jgi:phosphatidylserine/phosphatidylglycerophosphate/cardiolipin synthase-like enzyme
VSANGADRLVLDAADRRDAMVQVITGARRRLMLSLFRCDDFMVLDALAAALERGCEVRALLTRRAKGGRKRLRKLWEALEDMGAIVSSYKDPVVKYHAKYLVADQGPAIVATLNPTQKCFSRTWDCLLVTHDPGVVRSLTALFQADASGRSLPDGVRLSRRLIVGPERSRDEVRRLIQGARRSIRILDHKLSDPDVVALLRERRADGVTVSVLGRHPMGSVEPHGKMLLVDESCALVGSMAMSTLSLDFRREVSVIIDDAAMVRRLNSAFQQLSARVGAPAAELPGDNEE